MHYLHCILINIEGDLPDDISAMTESDYNDLMMTARSQAMDYTEDYAGQVFDYRSEDNAGSWDDEYPGKGVILGIQQPDVLKKEVLDWKDKPLHEAIGYLQSLTNPKRGWYSAEELKANPRLGILANNTITGKDDNGNDVVRYLAGEPERPLVVTTKWLKEQWESGRCEQLDYWRLKKAIALIGGDYTSDAGFYSMPDSSSYMSKETFEEVMKSPGKFALVYSDYHN